jgi:hypothetical protein
MLLLIKNVLRAKFFIRLKGSDIGSDCYETILIRRVFFKYGVLPGYFFRSRISAKENNAIQPFW